MCKRLILIVAGFLLVLSGCSGGSEPIVAQGELSSSTFEVYQTPDYLIQYPIGWKRKEDFALAIDKFTDVAFVSNIKEVFFTPTVTISKQEVSEGALARDFALKVIAQNEKGLLNYQLIDQNEIVISDDGQTTFLAQFIGKREPAENLIEYFQTYYVVGRNGYVITGAHDPNGDQVLAERLLDTVRSFQIR